MIRLRRAGFKRPGARKDRLVSMRRRGGVLGLVVLLVLGGQTELPAQITSITSSGLKTVPTPSGTTTFIDGGTRPGDGPNLFHSFGEFSVGEGHTALFRNRNDTGSSYDGTAIHNVFGRVTGNSMSSIFGTIDTATNFSQANLWLINPVGFLFGPTAALNVGGSVNISTADYLKMTDGIRFNVRPGPADTLLSMAPVQSFGFLGPNPGGTITIQGGTVKNAAVLTLVGRDIVDGSHRTVTPGLLLTGGTLETSGTSVNLVSVKTPHDTNSGGEILPDDLSPAPGQGFSRLGTVQLDSGGTLMTTATEGKAGSIVVRASDLVMRGGASILTQPSGTVPAGSIAVNVDNLKAREAVIFSNGNSDGSSGGITIQGTSGAFSPAKSVSLDSSAVSTTTGLGVSNSDAGSIKIVSDVITMANRSEISADVFLGTGRAGSIDIAARHLNLLGSIISSNVSNIDQDFTGTPGSISIISLGDTTVVGGTIIAEGKRISGSIRFISGNDLSLLGTSLSVKNTGSGDAGQIALIAFNNLLVRDSSINTESAQSSGGSIKLAAQNVILIADSKLTSSVQGQSGSNGGNISIDPIAVAIQNSQILAQANQGAGGNISVVASGAVLVDPNTTFDASAGPAGVSGSVNINAPIQVLGGTLVPLKVSYSQPALSGDRCAADPQGRFSSFVQTGRDGVPQIPGGYAPSPLPPLHRLMSSVPGVPGEKLAAARLGLTNLGVGASTHYQFQSGCRS